MKLPWLLHMWGWLHHHSIGIGCMTGCLRHSAVHHVHHALHLFWRF